MSITAGGTLDAIPPTQGTTPGEKRGKEKCDLATFPGGGYVRHIWYQSIISRKAFQRFWFRSYYHPPPLSPHGGK